MKSSILITALLLVAALPATAAATDGPPGIRHNPFARPTFDAPDRSGRVDLEADDSTATSIDLRITMVMDDKRLAYVGGKVLSPGDELDGYTLARVYEDRAVFTRADKTITVYVKPDLADDDDDPED